MNEKTVKIIATILVIVLFASAVYIKFHPIYAMKKALKNALLAYDTNIVENCERIYRLESANFTSGQFLGTYSAGMEPASPNYPYGWNSLKPFWDANSMYKPIGIKSYTENGTGIKKQFIQFPTVQAGVFSLCKWLEVSGNNPGRWFSTDPMNQLTYNEKINNINPSYTNEG